MQRTHLFVRAEDQDGKFQLIKQQQQQQEHHQSGTAASKLSYAYVK